MYLLEEALAKSPNLDYATDDRPSDTALIPFQQSPECGILTLV